MAADGRTIELPEAMFDVLQQVAAALPSGMGDTVAPHNRLTTQEAADFHGMSKPTLSDSWRRLAASRTGVAHASPPRSR